MDQLIRITTIPLSLEKLLEGQLTFMNNYYSVTAISAEKERLNRYGIDNGVNTFHVEMTREITPLADLKSLFKLFKFLRKTKPLIVHTHTPKAGIIGMLAGKLAGVPIRLHTVAGLPLLEVTGIKRKILNSVEKLTYTLATKVYPNSFELKQICINLGFAEEAKLKVLGRGSSNGIDTTYFDPGIYTDLENVTLKKALKIPDTDFVYVFVGRLVREKGINELVRAFVDINLKNDDTSLLLVGPFEQELDPIDHDVYKTIHDHPKIFITGYQPDVRPYFSISNVLAFPSYREGFPNVVLQAGAMSLPAIVTNINGCNEIVNHEENGLIIKVKNQSSLKDAMEKVLYDKNLCAKLKRTSRDFVRLNFERQQFWKILLKEYQELEVIHKHD